MAAVLTNHTELKEQYAIALRRLSEARFTYGLTSAEAVAATKRVEELERQLTEHPAARIGLKP